VAQQWFVTQTKFHAEDVVAKEIAALGIETFLPLARVFRRRSNGQLVSFDRPLISQYLFTRFDMSSDWRAIYDVRGVVRLMGNPEHPLPVRDLEIAVLRAAIAAQGGAIEVSSRPISISPGDLVRVLYGPFRDQLATAQANCGSRVEVLLRLAGALRLKLPRDCLTVVAA